MVRCGMRPSPSSASNRLLIADPIADPTRNVFRFIIGFANGAEANHVVFLQAESRKMHIEWLNCIESSMVAPHACERIFLNVSSCVFDVQ